MSDLDTIGAKLVAWENSVRAMTEEQVAALLAGTRQIASEIYQTFKQIERFGQLFSAAYWRNRTRRYHAYLRKRRRGQAWAKTTPYRYRKA